MAGEAKVQLSVTVAAELRTTNGVVVSIDETAVVIRKPGPNGGAGVSIPIALRDWDAVAEAVGRLRAAVSDARARIAPEGANR